VCLRGGFFFWRVSLYTIFFSGRFPVSPLLSGGRAEARHNLDFPRRWATVHSPFFQLGSGHRTELYMRLAYTFIRVKCQCQCGSCYQHAPGTVFDYESYGRLDSLEEAFTPPPIPEHPYFEVRKTDRGAGPTPHDERAKAPPVTPAVAPPLEPSKPKKQTRCTSSEGAPRPVKRKKHKTSTLSEGAQPAKPKKQKTTALSDGVLPSTSALQAAKHEKQKTSTLSEGVPRFSAAVPDQHTSGGRLKAQPTVLARGRPRKNACPRTFNETLAHLWAQAGSAPPPTPVRSAAVFPRAGFQAHVGYR
jgi:hypothetical protein